MLYVTYLLDHMIYQVPMYVGEREREGRMEDCSPRTNHSQMAAGL